MLDRKDEESRTPLSCDTERHGAVVKLLLAKVGSWHVVVVLLATTANTTNKVN
jgi:hypothetical protein